MQRIREWRPKGRATQGAGWCALLAGGVLAITASAQQQAGSESGSLEAAVRAGDAAAAAAALEAASESAEAADDRFWKAQACLLVGRDQQAAGLLAGLAAAPDAVFFKEAVLSHGAVWAARGETARAVRALEAGLESDDPEFLATLRLRLAELHLAQGGANEARALLRAAPASLERGALEARSAWMLGDHEEAARLAGPVAAQAPAGAARDTARLIQARVKAAAGQILEADRALLEWVRAEPGTVPLSAVMLALEEFNGLAAEEVHTLLEEWKVDPRSPLAPVAAYGKAAALAGRGDLMPAASAFEAFASAHETHPLAPVARGRAVYLALAAGQAGQARAWAESWRVHPSLERATAEQAQAAFLAGLAAWADGAPGAAVAAFYAAADQAPDPATQRVARLNAALGKVAAGGEPSASGLEAWPEAQALLFFEAGLFGARFGHPAAHQWLEEFLAKMPAGDARGPVAWSALVELDLGLPVPALPAARQHARAALRAAAEPVWREQAAWLAVLVEAACSDWAAALHQSGVFLQEWPQTERRPLVRFQRAEWLGRQDDWTASIQELTTLAAEAEAVPAAAARALYLAGLAELRVPSPDSLDRAIDRWRDAAAMDDTMVFPARYQQALAKGRLGKIDEAIRQFDALIAGPPALTPAQLSAVQLARGELLMLPAVVNEERLAEALIALQGVLDAPATTAPRRARALFRRGEALARARRTDDALSAFTEAAQPLLAPSAEIGSPLPTDDPWPARAGLAAVALLENRRDWAAAASLAQRLAATPGPHAQSARAKASRLRLEHFLWEE